jgi:hypothetical protein
MAIRLGVVRLKGHPRLVSTVDFARRIAFSIVLEALGAA